MCFKNLPEFLLPAPLTLTLGGGGVCGGGGRALSTTPGLFSSVWCLRAAFELGFSQYIASSREEAREPPASFVTSQFPCPQPVCLSAHPSNRFGLKGDGAEFLLFK